MVVDGSTIDDEPERRRSEGDTTRISRGRVMVRLARPLQPFGARTSLPIGNRRVLCVSMTSVNSFPRSLR